MKIKGFLIGVGLVGIPLVLFELLGINRLVALPYGAGTYNSCQYGSCGITLLSGGTVNLAVTPTTGGVYTTQSDEIQVTTSSSTGYTVTLNDADTTTSLENGGQTIATTNGSQVTPVQLALNTWGYRVDGLSGFGAGPTSAQTNQSSSSYTFAGLPASNQTGHIIKTTSGPANPAESTAIWYGVRADTNKQSGVYSSQVTYSAVIND